jgi:poly(3-hydroxybutyrate) depolymerase
MAGLECNKLIKRDITISDCEETNPDDCNRSYFLHFPTIICKEQNSSTAGDSLPTLPLVFAIHCFGCSAMTMFPSFIQHSNEHNFVLVVPEGIKNSWNARHCCGYALDKQLDDVGFISNIQSKLSNEYAFVKPQFTYATGWSNGGFMVMHASKLFRGIAPISGFIAGIDSELKRGGVSVGKPLFIHQGIDDPFVRYSGCCHDPTLPKCCCNIAADTCAGVMDVARNWAVEMNGCPNDEKLLVDTSYTNTDQGIQCLTSSNCMANTTICMYENSGHFNKPSFQKAFPMAKDVMNFFARDACEVNDGKWNGVDKTCLCSSAKFSGPFCLDAPATMRKGTTSISRVFVMISGLITLVLATYVTIQKLRRRGRMNGRGGKYTKVEVMDIEIARCEEERSKK